MKPRYHQLGILQVHFRNASQLQTWERTPAEIQRFFPLMAWTFDSRASNGSTYLVQEFHTSVLYRLYLLFRLRFQLVTCLIFTFREILRDLALAVLHSITVLHNRIVMNHLTQQPWIIESPWMHLTPQPWRSAPSSCGNSLGRSAVFP